MLSLHNKPTLTPNLFNAGFNALLIYQNMLHEKEKCPMLSLHDKLTLTPNSSMLPSMLYLYTKTCCMKKVSNVEFERQTNTDTKPLQCCFQCVQSNSTIHGNEKCTMLSLHDKPTLTPNLFNAGFNALLTYVT